MDTLIHSPIKPAELLKDLGHFLTSGTIEPIRSARAWVKLERFILTGDVADTLVAGIIDLAKLTPSFRSALALNHQNGRLSIGDLIHKTPYDSLADKLEQIDPNEQATKKQQIKTVCEAPARFSKIDLSGSDLNGLYDKLVDYDLKLSRIESPDLKPFREDSSASVNLFKLHREIWKERADVLLKLDQAWEIVDPVEFKKSVENQIYHAFVSYQGSTGYLKPSYENRLAEFVSHSTNIREDLKPGANGRSDLATLTRDLIAQGDWRPDYRYQPTGYQCERAEYRALFPELHFKTEDPELYAKMAERAAKARLKLIGEK